MYYSIFFIVQSIKYNQVQTFLHSLSCQMASHNLAGFSSSLFTTLIACSQISCPVVVEERLAMSKNSSTTSKPTVTALMNKTSRAVSLMSLLSYKARLKAAHNFNLSFEVLLILFERSFALHETEKREKLVCST